MSQEKAQGLIDAVKWFTLSEELLPSPGRVLVAVSGGADSMAMLSILHILGQELGFHVSVAHFDHQIRAAREGEADRALVEGFARRLSLPFYSGGCDVPALARTDGDSLETAARKARYRFLFDMSNRTRADRVATGHTRDDQAETVIMRVIRGTGIRGLAGIPVRRGRIIRPLLGVGREETRLYCRSHKIPFADDPTNSDVSFFRNRIRHELLPMLQASYNDGVCDNLLRLAKNAQEVVKGIRSRTGPLIDPNLRKVSETEWVLNVSRIAGLDETELFVLFGDIFSDVLACDMDFSRVHYEQLARIVKNSRGSGKMLSLPGLDIKREYENLIMTRRQANSTLAAQRDHRAALTFPGETQAAGLTVKTEILDPAVLAGHSVKATHRAAFFALEHLTLPLVLRSPRAGDRMQPFGMRGTKKLSDIFVDRKIPGRERPKSLVVEDAAGIVWLVGVTTSEKSRVETTTRRIVRISVHKPGE